jgi:hypothetical protein
MLFFHSSPECFEAQQRAFILATNKQPYKFPSFRENLFVRFRNPDTSYTEIKTCLNTKA